MRSINPARNAVRRLNGCTRRKRPHVNSRIRKPLRRVRRLLRVKRVLRKNSQKQNSTSGSGKSSWNWLPNDSGAADRSSWRLS